MRSLLIFLLGCICAFPCGNVFARPITPSERTALDRLDDFAKEVIAEGNPDAKLASDIHALKSDIEKEIEAIAVGANDPPELKAVLWAVQTWEKDPAKYSKLGDISSALPIRDLESGTYKCNRFVADAYGVGASRGFAPHGKGGAYPVGETKLFWYGYPPSANELGNTVLVLPNLYAVPQESSRLGYVIAFPNPAGIGHSGVFLGRGLYISARNGSAPAAKLQVADGVQITRIPSERAMILRKFAYGFDFDFEFRSRVSSRRFYITSSFFKVTLAAESSSPAVGAKYVVSLVRVADGDHSECVFEVGKSQYCQWRKQKPGEYYMEVYKKGGGPGDGSVFKGKGYAEIL